MASVCSYCCDVLAGLESNLAGSEKENVPTTPSSAPTPSALPPSTPPPSTPVLSAPPPSSPPQEYRSDDERFQRKTRERIAKFQASTIGVSPVPALILETA
uniref:Uncharacterized protein n=1 Tax=Ditylenchus dipsaci TaxID=166011 RepID=A0A915DDY0_9BILA